MRIALEEIARGEQAQREVKLLRENEAHWRAIVAERDSIIRILRSNDAAHAAIVDGFTVRLNLAEQQHELTKKWAGELNSKLKKQRRKTFLWAIGGTLATAASIYFLK